MCRRDVLECGVVRVKMAPFAVSLPQVVSGLNQGGGTDNWQPIRIKAFYDDSIGRCVYKISKCMQYVVN